MTGTTFGSYGTCKFAISLYSNICDVLFWNTTCIIGAAVILGAQHDGTHVGLVQQSPSGNMRATHVRSALHAVHPHLRISRVQDFGL
jgi:hypothetical protein